MIGTMDFLERLLRDQGRGRESLSPCPSGRFPGWTATSAVAEEMGVGVRSCRTGRSTDHVPAEHSLHELRGVPGGSHHGPQDHIGQTEGTPYQERHGLCRGGPPDRAPLPLPPPHSRGHQVSSSGPVFFSQLRCGLNGRRFLLYKFRTMAADAETQRKELAAHNEADGPVFKIRKDPRIIPAVGTFLRKTGLDEMPQLLNVLKGEMSLVAPDPPSPRRWRNTTFGSDGGSP